MAEPNKITNTPLQASEELYRVTLAHIIEALFITDDIGNLIFVSPNVNNIFGYSPEEITAWGKISRLLGEDLFDQQQLEQQGQLKNIERSVRHKAGHRCIISINVKSVSIQGGTRLYCCQDITERRKAEEALYQERERFRLLIESVKDYAIFMLDALGMVESWNMGAETITGYLTEQIIGQHYSCFYPPEELAEEKPWQALRQASIEGPLEQEGWYVRRDNTQFWGDVVITPLRDKYGYLEGFSVVMRDFTERKRLSEQLWHAAYHDELTGLPNRALFKRQLKEATERIKTEKNYQFAILFLDLDRFKLINDSLGHSMGDQLLVAIAKQIQTFLGEKDIVARLGGDEFAVLIDNLSDISHATTLAEDIHNSLKSPFLFNGHEVYTTVSIGITVSGSALTENELIFNQFSSSEISPGMTANVDTANNWTLYSYDRPEDLLRDADTAMYLAKAKGRAKHEVFNSEMHKLAVKRLQMETELRRAVAELPNPFNYHQTGQFILLYQPIVSLESGLLNGFEALLRWEHPKMGTVSPREFIPIAEDIGLIIPLGAWVLRMACWQLHYWQEKYHLGTRLILNINISGKQITTVNLINQIDEILRETGLTSENLRLEITETLLMENGADAMEVLEELRRRNIKLAIDDFGTGYSSLSYLHQLPVSTLKIDKSFVSRLGAGDDNNAIVKAIIMLAGNLGVSVVAEGIETEEQLKELWRLQCDYGQGYFFAEPLPGEEAEKLIAEDRHW